MLVGLTQLHIWSCALTESPNNGSCIILVAYSSVALSRMTQLHMTHSSTCNIVWFHQDSSTRHPVGVPGMVDQPQNPKNM